MADRPIDRVPSKGEAGYWHALAEEQKEREAADSELRRELRAAQLKIEEQIADGLAAIPRETVKLAETAAQLLATASELRATAGRGWLWNGVLLIAVVLGFASLAAGFGHHWLASHPGTALRLGQIEERSKTNGTRIDEMAARLKDEIVPRIRSLERNDLVEEVIGHRPGSPTMPPASRERPVAPRSEQERKP